MDEVSMSGMADRLGDLTMELDLLRDRMSDLCLKDESKAEELTSISFSHIGVAIQELESLITDLEEGQCWCPR